MFLPVALFDPTPTGTCTMRGLPVDILIAAVPPDTAAPAGTDCNAVVGATCVRMGERYARSGPGDDGL